MGTHFCQFYQNREDLVDILVPYFKAGLENNEFCMWVTAEPLLEEEAKNALQKAVPDIDRYLEQGQIEIIPYNEWYVKEGSFDSSRVLNGLVDKLNNALENGFDGLRLTGNTFWLEKEDWNDFIDYEEAVDSVIGEYRMIALCTYSMEKCTAAEIIDVINNHEFALAMREGEWELIETMEHKGTEKALRESEKRFRSFFELSLIGIAITSPDKGWIEANDKICQILGYSCDELFKTTLDKITHPDDLDKDTEQLNSLMDGYIDEYTLEKRFIRKDGSVVNTNVSVGCIRNKDNGVKYFVVLIEDISSRKRAEEALMESEEKFRSTIEQSLEGIALVDIKGSIIEWNNAMEKITGLKRDYVLGKYLWDVQYELTTEEGKASVSYEQLKKAIKEIISNKEILKSMQSMEREIITPKGEIKAVQTIAFPITTAKGMNIMGTIFQDITLRKKMEEKLKKAYSNMELRVKESTAELNMLIHELKRSNDELQQFANVASHDLQEPLRTIASFTQLLERRYKGHFDSDADEFMNYIVDATKRMQQLIDDLLKYSRVTTKGKEFKPVNVNEVLDTVLSNLKMSIDEHDAEIIYDKLPAVNADELQLVQLFQNLIGNAIKFRKIEESPKIQVSANKSENEYVFSVADNGIGIESQYLDRIFVIFQRLHTIDKYKGTGIGLSVAKKIVERHGGKIWAESESGEGSTFYFTIPVEPAEMGENF